MSRSAFAARFHARVGTAHLDHLTHWRMIRARRAPIDSDQPFATIAVRNGYCSRTSCSQSFKRSFGHSTKKPIRTDVLRMRDTRRALFDPTR
jgi:AraC-like DNA-binding protein